MTKQKRSATNATCHKPLRVCGVIGAPIEHSLSPKIHKHFAKQCNMNLTYNKIQGIEAQVEAQINAFFDEGGIGLNVTLPFKVKAFNMARHHTPSSLQSGVANTLWCNDEGDICAANTDGLGLLFALGKYTTLAEKHVLILGAGGAAQGVIPSFLDASLASLTVANRSEARLAVLSKRFPNVNYLLFNELKADYDVIINATSSSLNQSILAIPLGLLNGCFCMDMAYDLAQDTLFVQLCKQQGALVALDGIDMLVGQAAESFQHWHQKNVNRQLTLNYLFEKVCD